MIVNKPQFDVKKIKPGQAYWLKVTNRNFAIINTPCLIRKVNPLEISVKYYKESARVTEEGAFENLTIKIEDVVEKSVELTPMIAEKSND